MLQRMYSIRLRTGPFVSACDVLAPFLVYLPIILGGLFLKRGIERCDGLVPYFNIP